MTTRIGFTTLALILFTTACGDNSNDTDTESTDDTGAAESTGTTPEPTGSDTGSEPSTSGEQPTTGDTTGTDDTTTEQDGGTTTATSSTTDENTTDTTTEGETAGPVDPELVSGCEAYCAHWTECGFPSDGPACVDGCVENFGELTGECLAANKAMLACTNTLTCEQLIENDDGPCDDEEAAVVTACESSEEEEENCGVGIGQLGDAECDLMLQCDGQPLQEMRCMGETCTCLIDGAKTGECQADGICMDTAEIEAKGAACCGF